jgi:hypothetical protein
MHAFEDLATDNGFEWEARAEEHDFDFDAATTNLVLYPCYELPV